MMMITRLALPVVVAATVYAAPALTCSPSEPPSLLDTALLPATALVPQNAALFARPVGLPTTVTILKAGEAATTLTSDTGDIPLRTFDPNSDYELTIEAGGETQVRAFRTTDAVDLDAPAAPTASVDVFESGGGFDVANTCDSGGPFVWRNATSTASVSVDVVEGAVAAVRVDEDGDVVEVSASGSFFFSESADADGARFALIDAAGNLSDATTVDVDAAGGGCAQTSAPTAMALSLVALVLARRRR
jgi:hypothetical protein